jgi:hypothetical protein
MFHGSANLTIDKGCEFNTKKAVIQVKSAQPTITVDNAKLNSEGGVILQAMANDDPNMKGGMMGGPPGGMPGGEGGAMMGGRGGDAAGGVMPGSAPGSMMPEGGMQGGAGGGPGGAMPEGGRQGGMPGGGSSEVKATFRNMTLTGDIVTSMTGESDVIVNFENATITGAITTATAVPVGEPSYEKFYLIGEVADTYCATDDKYGIKASLDDKSKWVVDETSYLTGLTIAEGATVSAPEGGTLTMTVNGVQKPIKAGTYSGKIVLTVTKS